MKQKLNKIELSSIKYYDEMALNTLIFHYRLKKAFLVIKYQFFVKDEKNLASTLIILGRYLVVGQLLPGQFLIIVHPKTIPLWTVPLCTIPLWTFPIITIHPGQYLPE